MKPATKQVSPGFSLTAEVVITSEHGKHRSGTFQKFNCFLKGKSAMSMITDMLAVALLELQSQESLLVLLPRS